MKKWLLILLVILIAGGVGYYLYMQKSSTTSSNPFSSIKDALNKSLSLQCSFTDEEGRQTTVYMKAGAVRMNSIAKNPNEENGQSSVIMKNNMLYMWDIMKKQGFVMKMENEKKPTGTAVQPTGEEKSSEKSENILATIEKYKNSCKPAVVDSSLFDQPSDVKFVDFSTMMKGPSSNGQSPVNQQQIQQMMQQYQQGTPANADGQ